MSFFGSSTSTFGTSSTTGMFGTATNTNYNAMKDIEVTSPPDDSVSCLKFSPESMMQSTYLVGGSWDNNDGTKVFTASCDKTAKMWDLNSNQFIQIAQHDAPVKTIQWVKAPNYSCVMTGSWDKTLKFWDTRQAQPIMSIQLPERCYCADVKYPMAVVGTAGRGLIIYQLENQPQEFRKFESPLKYQTNQPTGFALGSIEGRVAIHYVNPTNPKDNFTFKCHRANGTSSNMQDIYAVNDISFHPVHGTLATVGSDGRFSFWDKDARIKLKTSEQFDQPLTACNFNPQGNIFAYATSYDWSKKMKPHIFLRRCFDELKPSTKKS
ncbi:RAEL1-like protein [Mya arenaria]|uniref:RAEL1-like protein n=1 Tax=Mya arenaria TaxID=6604 RepID=A0ABY7FVR5_MYAAR|nr:RAEL1-like protein [Mya arenaria]WAR24931.1 RAEL1-like protein [Mya arenaria]